MSDAEGRFSIDAAPTTAKELDVKVPGFESLRMAMPSGNAKAMRIVLSPVLADGEVRIVVTWDRQPPDLDVDAKKGFGPETITVRTRPGKYSYYVAHNDSLGTNQGERLGQSNAQVRVYHKGAGTNQPFVMPTKVTGPAWHVLDVMVDAAGKISVQPMNQFAKDLPTERARTPRFSSCLSTRGTRVETCRGRVRSRPDLPWWIDCHISPQ